MELQPVEVEVEEPEPEAIEATRGKEIRDLRHSLGLPQNRLAHLLCVGGATVSRWECDHVEPAPLVGWLLRQLAIVARLDPGLLTALLDFDHDRRRFWAGVLGRAGEQRER
jgi:DNA-binding transcriptional regulator YiaG